MPRETSYQKQKRLLKESEEKYRSLYNDFRAYHKGNTYIVCKYSTVFKMEESFEKMLWQGNTTLKNA